MLIFLTVEREASSLLVPLLLFFLMLRSCHTRIIVIPGLWLASKLGDFYIQCSTIAQINTVYNRYEYTPVQNQLKVRLFEIVSPYNNCTTSKLL